MSYQRVTEEAERPPQKIRDWTAQWEKLTPLGTLNGDLAERVAALCESKRITLAALEALGTRLAIRRGGGIWLAWAGTNGNGVVTAIKYRPLEGSSHDSETEKPSVWLRPIVAGRRESLDWFLAEGETEAARLFGLVGDSAAILCLPAGARAFKDEWAALVPRGATVYLAHDADEDGDLGAEKAASALGGSTVRLRPPEGVKDWCEWDGGRDEFVELVRAAKSRRRAIFLPARDFLKLELPNPEPLLGRIGDVFLAAGSFLLVCGAEGATKSTWTLDGIAHLAAGQEWLGIDVPRPVRVCVIENEGPGGLFQEKLGAKAASWDGGDGWLDNVASYSYPWGQFSFADPGLRADLMAFCDEFRADLVTANPLLGLGAPGSGKPEETKLAVSWLVECGLWSRRAFWLLHHENKAGQISGDWGRHPDTIVILEQDGNRPRTKLTWHKTRWAKVPSDERPKKQLLEWLVETEGYKITDLDTVTVSDDELQQRLDEWLADNPGASKSAIERGVPGDNNRLRRLLDAGHKRGDYHLGRGPRNAQSWSLRSSEVAEPAGSSDSETSELEGFPHE